MVFQTAPVHRLEDKDPSREVCWRELHLHLLGKCSSSLCVFFRSLKRRGCTEHGVFNARKFFLNASLEEEDYAQLVEALEVGLDRLHEDGLV